MSLQEQGVVEVVGLCDPSAAQRAKAGRAMPGVRAFGDLETLLARTPCDLLTIASPPSFHLPAMILALERGIDVVCEKPIGLHAGDVDRLRALASASSNPLIATVHQYCHAEGWQAAQSLLRRAIRRDKPFTLRVEVERSGTDPLSAGGWRAQPEKEGGILGDHAVHYLSLILGLGADVRVLQCSRRGEGGRETAAIRLAVGPGEATIVVTYEGKRRQNLIEVEAPADRRVLRWCDGALTISRRGRTGPRHPLGGLSDRGYVNALYEPFYRDIAAAYGDPDARRRITHDTVEVAAMLQQCLATAAAGQLVAAGEDSDFLRDALDFVDQQFSALARAVLLAFADLGVYLDSNRDRLINKIRALDPLDPKQMTEFLDLCIEAELITPMDAGRLRLSPAEAKRLGRSLEGNSPVPDDQAMDWARQLGAGYA
jgi:predicted dehydrogenase